MKKFRYFVLPIAAMAVAFVWSLMLAGPQGQRVPYPLPNQELVSLDWQQEAEQAFGLRPGQGAHAMTQQEWESHQRKMWAMPPKERERYQQEVRVRILGQVKG
jgi:hypothetical protein